MRRLDLGFKSSMLCNIHFTNVFQRVIRVSSLSLSSPKSIIYFCYVVQKVYTKTQNSSKSDLL